MSLHNVSPLVMNSYVSLAFPPTRISAQRNASSRRTPPPKGLERRDEALEGGRGGARDGMAERLPAVFDKRDIMLQAPPPCLSLLRASHCSLPLIALCLSLIPASQ